MWWIVIVVSVDWYTMLDSVEIIEAETAVDAMKQIGELPKWKHIEHIFGPFDERPQEV